MIVTSRASRTVALCTVLLAGTFVGSGSAWAAPSHEVAGEARTLLDRALVANERGRPLDALELFMKAYRISPYVLAVDDHGLLDGATNALRDLALEQPANGQAHFRLAEVLALRGMNDEGLRHYEEAAKAAVGTPIAVLAKSAARRLRASMAEASAQVEAAERAAAPANAELGRCRADVDYLVGRIHDLEDQNKRLRAELDQAREELGKSQADVVAANAATDKKEQEGKRDRLYWNLYWSDPANAGRSLPGVPYVPPR